MTKITTPFVELRNNNISKHNNNQVNISKNGGVEMSKTYSCNEVAERYGVKTGTVWEWVRNKKIPAIKIGKLYRIREKDLQVFESERMTVR